MGARLPPRLILALAAGLWLVPAAAPGDDADSRYAVAAGHYARQRWELAAEAFGEFLDRDKDDPRRSEALFFLAESLARLKRYPQAAARFREYLQREPSGRRRAEALFGAGEALYLSGSRDAAKGIFDRFSKDYPDHPLQELVLPFQGELALARGESQAAEQLFRKALDRFPQGRLQDRCRFGLAKALENQDKNEEAEKLLLALSVKPGFAAADGAQYHLGAVQFAQGKYAEAVTTFAAFEERLAASPLQAGARMVHGWALLKLDRPDEAAAVFRRIVDHPREGLEARFWLGQSQRAAKRWDAAAKTLLEAAEAGPKHRLNTAMRFYAGDALLRSGDPAGAVAQFNLVLAASNDAAASQRALRGKVQALLEQKDFAAADSEAVAFLKRFSDGPLAADVKRLLARSLLERKEFRRAADLLTPLVKQPAAGVLEERYLLALAYEGLKQYEEALAALAPVLEAKDVPFRADALLTQASALVAQKRFADAIGPLEAYAATSPRGDGEVRGGGQLAICYARTGQLDKAKKAFADLFQNQPKHPLLLPTVRQLAEAALDAGDTAWSGRLYRWLGNSEAPSDQLSAVAGVGWSHFRAGRFSEAAAAFQQVLDRDPPAALAANTALACGRALEKLQRHDAALEKYDLVIQRHAKSPEEPQALLAAAQLHRKRKQHEKAEPLFRRLANEFPKLAEMDAALYGWAWTLTDLGRPDDAAAAFDRIRKEHREGVYWADATLRLTQRAIAASQYDRARELVAELLAAKIDDRSRESALYLRGQIETFQQKWKEAEAAFTAVLEAYPRGTLRTMGEFGLAEALFRQDRLAEAATRLDKLAAEPAETKRPWGGLVELRRAQILCQEGKWTAAYEIAAKIEQDYPGFEEQYEADYVLGRCLADRAEFDAAREKYRRVIDAPQGKKTRRAADAQLMIGDTYFHQKDYAAARREYLKVEILYDFPAVQAAALLQAGKCSELAGRWDDAAETYNQLLKSHPNTPEAKEAQRRLAAKKKE